MFHEEENGLNMCFRPQGYTQYRDSESKHNCLLTGNFNVDTNIAFTKHIFLNNPMSCLIVEL